MTERRAGENYDRKTVRHLAKQMRGVVVVAWCSKAEEPPPWTAETIASTRTYDANANGFVGAYTSEHLIVFQAIHADCAECLAEFRADSQEPRAANISSENERRAAENRDELARVRAELHRALEQLAGLKAARAKLDMDEVFKFYDENNMVSPRHEAMERERDEALDDAASTKLAHDAAFQRENDAIASTAKMFHERDSALAHAAMLREALNAVTMDNGVAATLDTMHLVRAALSATEADVAKWLAERDEKKRNERGLTQPVSGALLTEAQLAERDACVRAEARKAALEDAAVLAEQTVYEGSYGYRQATSELLRGIARDIRALGDKSE